MQKETRNDKAYEIIQQWQNRDFKTRSLQKQLKLKGSEFRNVLSTLLKLWRVHRSLIIIHNIYSLSPKMLSKILCHSKAFKNRKSRQYGRKMRTTNEWSRNIKRGLLRNKIALCLKTWKRLRSIAETSKTLNIKRAIVSEYLKKSKAYRHKHKYSTAEREYAYVWAWKLIAIKTLNGKCFQCNENDPVVLELHHLDKNQKEKCFSDMIRKHSYSYKLIRKEIEKCNLLCRNCHQETHNNKSPKNLKNKKFILSIQNNVGACTKCGYNKNISCLEFHHKNKNSKIFELSLLTDPRRNYDSMKISNKKFSIYKREIKKCVALCCNCHQIIHTKIDKLKNLNRLIQMTIRLMDRNYVWKC